MKVNGLVLAKAVAAKQASYAMAVLPTEQKNRALLAMATALEKRAELIIGENEKDVAQARQQGLARSLLDRLMLNEDRLCSMAEGLRQTASLPDPIGEGISAMKRPTGLEIRKVRVPLGVIGVIYEARPNVTADAIGLCLKSGNAVILRGGSEAILSNRAIVSVLIQAASENDIPLGAIQFIETTDRGAVQEMLQLHGYLDVVIPRGGKGLIDMVVANSKVPVIETGTGVCHTFVDETADLAMAEAIVMNAKTSRPAVCNAMETLLVHEKIATDFLLHMIPMLIKAGVELRGCKQTMAIYPVIKAAAVEDWSTEYSDLILAIKVVPDIKAAIDHINKYNTKHSEAIITANYKNARRFQQEVDAAAVYVNASTRFTDGFEFGFGGEIGISTQKLHARGPMGLAELTSVKYLIDGDGQIR